MVPCACRRRPGCRPAPPPGRYCVEPLFGRRHVELLEFGAALPTVDANHVKRPLAAEMVDHRTGRASLERADLEDLGDLAVAGEGEPVVPMRREPIGGEFVIVRLHTALPLGFSHLLDYLPYLEPA